MLWAYQSNSTLFTYTNDLAFNISENLLQIELADLPVRCRDGRKTTLQADEPRSYNTDRLTDRLSKLMSSILIQMKIIWEIPRAS